MQDGFCNNLPKSMPSAKEMSEGISPFGFASVWDGRRVYERKLSDSHSSQKWLFEIEV